MIKHFINLTNSIEAIPEISDFNFIRIQSTTLERKNFYKLFADLDHNLLMWLALGYECQIHDFGTNRTTSKTIYLGLPVIEYCLNKYWHRYEMPQVWSGRKFSTNIKERAESIYQDLFIYHHERRLPVKIALDAKYKYYRRFIPIGNNRVLLIGISKSTRHDSDISYYKGILQEEVRITY